MKLSVLNYTCPQAFSSFLSAGATGCPVTGSKSAPRSRSGEAADAGLHSMRKAATASTRTANTSSQATTTVWTTYNSFHRPVIKPRLHEKPQRTMHGIEKAKLHPVEKQNPESSILP